MDDNYQEDNLDLMSFDLGEMDGGKQMIFANKPINDREYYVLTLGDGPKETEEPVSETKPSTESYFDKIRNHIPGLNKNKPAVGEGAEVNHTKLRCFKLTKTEGKKYLIEEYVTPQAICEVARFMGAGQSR